MLEASTVLDPNSPFWLFNGTITAVTADSSVLFDGVVSENVVSSVYFVFYPSLQLWWTIVLHSEAMLFRFLLHFAQLLLQFLVLMQLCYLMLQLCLIPIPHFHSSEG